MGADKAAPKVGPAQQSPLVPPNLACSGRDDTRPIIAGLQLFGCSVLCYCTAPSYSCPPKVSGQHCPTPVFPYTKLDSHKLHLSLTLALGANRSLSIMALQTHTARATPMPAGPRSGRALLPRRCLIWLRCRLLWLHRRLLWLRRHLLWLQRRPRLQTPAAAAQSLARRGRWPNGGSSLRTARMMARRSSRRWRLGRRQWSGACRRARTAMQAPSLPAPPGRWTSGGRTVRLAGSKMSYHHVGLRGD